jgi:hypothetical protein
VAHFFQYRDSRNSTPRLRLAIDVVNGSGILNCRVNGEHVQIRF